MVKMVKSSAGMKRFSPLDDRIVIERVVAPEKTAGGLFIPDSAQEKPTVGKVVAVGRGHRDAKGRTRPCDVKVGDAVLFTAWSGAEIEVDGQKYVIMRETDLLGVTTA
ncbi:co-chaperone GroES [soil metagenome]